MNKRMKLGLMIVLVLSLTASLVAFRPYQDADEDGISDHTEALAQALGIDVETLEAAFEAAKEKALAQAVVDGELTQEEADAILAGEYEGQRGPGKFRPKGDGSYLADELGITVEELEAAQLEARVSMMDQALENGDITQEQYDNMMECVESGECAGPGGPGGRGKGPGGPGCERPEGAERPEGGPGGRHQRPEPTDSDDG